MNKYFALALGIALAGAAAAQQYKWTDQNGKVQYGDIPPPGVKATPLRPTPPSSGSGEPATKKDGKKELTPEAAFQKRQQEARETEEKAAKERADAQMKRENCESAQASLRMLQSGQRVSTTNAAGERVFMEDAQRAQQIERTQRAVGEWCK
jgi:Domain of unknown function (DUF4124)